MIKYKITARKTPHSGVVKYYASAISPTPVNLQNIVDRVSARTTLTGSDVKAVLDALEFEIIDSLSQGNVVRLNDLGSFRPSLRGRGAEKEADYSAELITKVNVVYTPSLRIKSALRVGKGGMQFSKVEVFETKKKKAKKPSSGTASEGSTSATSEHH